MKSLGLGIGSLVFSLFLQAASLSSPSNMVRPDACIQPNSFLGNSTTGKENGRRLSTRQDVTEKNISWFFRNLFSRFSGHGVRAFAKRLQEPGPGDQLAKLSWWIGLVAFACALYPWYTLLVTIPLGIIAIALATKAKRSGSRKRNGKGFGILAIVGFFIWTILALLLLSFY